MRYVHAVSPSLIYLPSLSFNLPGFSNYTVRSASPEVVICVPVPLSVCLSLCLSVCGMYVCLYVCLSVSLSVSRSLSLSLPLPLSLPLSLSIKCLIYWSGVVGENSSVLEWSQVICARIVDTVTSPDFQAFAEAACKHVVEIAQATLRESPERHTPALREFAAVSEKDAEEGAHRIFRKYGLAAPVKLRRINIGPGPLQRFPYLNFSDWVKYLLETRQLSQLCGTNDIARMNVLLDEFWRRYRLVEPDYELWQLADSGQLDLKFTIPVYSHSDEGRTLKKKPFWILSCHGALGLGTKKNKERMCRHPTTSVRMACDSISRATPGVTSSWCL